ncbi:MAG TPA: hypothetical protein DCF33_06400 [Saprospirales bacterium]|nr:hypothetical protein [Saprospirales bacterium]
MKNACTFASILFFVLFATTAVNAQKTATWKGGTPGKAQEWNCPTNWKEGRVPDAFSDVLIPDVAGIGGYQPVIRTASNEVNTLSIMPGARLRIESTGTLEVFDAVQTVANGNIDNHGLLNAPMGNISHLGREPYVASNK